MVGGCGRYLLIYTYSSSLCAGNSITNELGLFQVFTAAALLAGNLQRHRKINPQSRAHAKVEGSCSLYPVKSRRNMLSRAVSLGFCTYCWLSSSFLYTCRCSYEVILSPHTHLPSLTIWVGFCSWKERWLKCTSNQRVIYVHSISLKVTLFAIEH